MTYDECAEEMSGWLEIRALPGHFSRVLVDQMARHCVDRTVSVFAVLDEIGRMQGTWPGKPLGEPAQFRHEPLAGLWKQHFFEARNLVRNLMNEARTAESDKAFQKIADAINRDEKPKEGIHDLIIGGHQRRAQTGTLTGEWIVYARDDDGKNYFLTLAKHFECDQREGETRVQRQQRSDAIIHERIVACRPDFPNLTL